MCTKQIDGNAYLSAVCCGAALLKARKEEINALNVFPIPDGDTGDNMYMTVSSGCSGCPGTADLGNTASALAKGMLLGARGNSGVILSQIFSGISDGLAGSESCGLSVFMKAMDRAVQKAYGSVSTPVEGTILTVLKDSVRYANGCHAESFENYFDALTEEMAASLDRTPDLLEVLKSAGVVDSGGAGLLCIMEGMKDAISGKAETPSYTDPVQDNKAPAIDLDAFGPDSELEYGYCTEFLLRLQNSKLDPESFDLSEIRSWLESVGESVVCFREGSIVKVHVHTFSPGEILNKCQQWGEFLTVKIENMTLQHSEKVAKDPVSSHLARKKRIGIVAVAAGEGMTALFREAGADVVIEGGQTMNPSAAAFIEAFRECAAEHILVFPNNSNIVMTARQAADMYPDANVRVVGCKNPGAGYVAVAGTDRSGEDFELVAANAEETCRSINNAMVSVAIRDTHLGGRAVPAGEYLGICGGEIKCASPERPAAAAEIAELAGLGEHDVAIVFHGKDVSSEEAGKLCRDLQGKYPCTEIILKNGGQPVYDYMITLC